jgi:UDP-galactopyranose mutase
MNILIVGCGFAGATIGRILAEAGHQINIIEQRNHIAGNAYDKINEHGIRVHQYGPHIFHTSNHKVVDWLSQFTEWVEYKHKVLDKLNPKELHVLPINKNTSSIYSLEKILDIFYKPYTRKMWGLPLEQVNPKILERVPIRDDENEWYFPNDTFQAMPKHGYTKIFENILNHPNIKVELSKKFDKKMEDDYEYCFNSMAIDEYYEYCYGELPYRSIRFQTVTLPEVQLYQTAVTNFTTVTGPTRVTEWKHFSGLDDKPISTLTYEFPCDYRDNNYERYYPINDLAGENQRKYNEYKKIMHPKMSFIGRCGNYLYLDMHQVISASLSLAQKFIQQTKTN